MSPKSPETKPGESPELPPSVPKGDRELIVIASPTINLRARPAGLESLTGSDVSLLAKALSESGAAMKPLFGPSEDHLNLREAAPGLEHAAPVHDLALYYQVACPNEMMDSLAARLRALPIVEAAYVKPAPEPAVERLNTMMPRPEEAPPTPNFVANQGYLGPAPVGVDAAHSWTVPGGGGRGVRVIDIEGAWRFTHEDLTQEQGGVVGGTQSADVGWRNHGTAVIGVIGADRNSFGVTGISPDANVRAISIFGNMGSAGAIRRAADLLSVGDIILIELHRPGPLASGVGQQGFIAIEWWPDDYDAIRYATSRGVIVIEAAGNGAQNLDDPAYDNPGAGFPASWSNPFRRGARDSGAVLVGAGAPPPGTHGRTHGPDRSRLDFSNYGTAVDAQGWGREVTTCGYGDLQGGANEDLWYTDAFSGTSSASPVVVGSVACIQGVRRARSLPPLTPAGTRALLRSTGSAQQDAPGRPASQRIGNRPNIRQMIARLEAPQVTTVPLHRYWNAGIGDHFYTTNWNELGGGRNGWVYEGIQCHVYPTQIPGTTALYRYWNPGIGDHFYTTNWNELQNGAHGWNFEGIQCYVRLGPVAGATGLYRYWNPTVGDHFYTTSWAELGGGAHGWRLEGVQCYVETVARTAPAVEAPVMSSVAPPPDQQQASLAWPVPSADMRPDGGVGDDNANPAMPAPTFVDLSRAFVPRSSMRAASSDGATPGDSFTVIVPDSVRSMVRPGGGDVRVGKSSAAAGGVTVNIELSDRRD